MKTKDLTLNGTPGYFQLGDETCLITDPPHPVSSDLGGVDIKGFSIAAKDGLAWNDNDALPSASATRGEFRSRDVRANGVWYTDAWDLTRTPETHPLYGSTDSNMKQTEGQWMNGKQNRPVAFIRLLGDRESIFINPYGARKPAGLTETVYPFCYGTRRYCTQIRMHNGGLMDFVYWVDGELILGLPDFPVDDPGNLGDLHVKIGVYLRKRELGLKNGAPDLWVKVDNFRSHRGVATVDDTAPSRPISVAPQFVALAAAVRKIVVPPKRQAVATRIAKSLDRLAANIRADAGETL